MKTKLLLVSFIMANCLFFSSTSFAQRNAGGSSDGSGGTSGGGSTGSGDIECVIEPTPTSFKRNNGQGTCGGDGQVRLHFNQDPSKAPTLIALLYKDGSPVTHINFPIEGDVSMLDKKKYISYCLDGGNIIPAKKLTAIFHYQDGCEDVVVEEK